MSRPSGLWLTRLSVAALAVATVYNAVVTEDVKVVRVPLKTYLLLACLLLWAIERRPWRKPRPLPRLTVPVVVVGAGVPVVWLLIAVIGHKTGAADQHGTLTYAITEASHFVSLMLFFPLLDYVRARGDHGERIWVGAVQLTCAITIAIWIAYVVFGYDYSQHTLTLLSGTIGAGPGPYRVELVTQVMLIPALALALAEIAAGNVTRRSAALVGVILLAAYAAHTRGYWLGLLTVSAVLIVLRNGWPAHRSARMTVIALIVVGLIASQVYPAVESASSVHELSLSTRLVEARQLLHGTSVDPVIGSGLGATLADGYARSPSNPWSFELTYYQLLFELGIVGLLIVLALPLGLLVATLRRISGLDGDALRHARAAVAGLLGLLVVDSTNPDLLNSVGMLAVAVVCVSGELALAGASPPVPRLPPPRSVAEPSAAPRVPIRRRTVLVGSVVAVALVVAAGFLALRPTSHKPAQNLRAIIAALPGSHLNAPGVVARTLRVTASAARALSGQLVTSIDGTSTQTVWSFDAGRDSVRATPLYIRGREVSAGMPLELPALSGRHVTYDVAPWTPTGRLAVYEMRPDANAVQIRVVSLDSRGVTLMRATTPAIPLARGAERALSVTRSDEFGVVLSVVDQGAEDHDFVVRSYAYKSDFGRALLVRSVHAGGGFPARDWAVLPGPTAATLPSLAFIGHPPGGTGEEVRVFSATNEYASYALRVGLGSLAFPRGQVRYVLSYRAATGGVLAVDPARGVVEQLLIFGAAG